jgi:hypothetical protein
MSEEITFLSKCIECGADFFTEGERDFYNRKGLNMPKRCKTCRAKNKAKYEQDQYEKEKQEKQKELEEILSTLPFKHIEKTEIPFTDANTSLFVIGNGFDIMHGVPSSYYNFRDSIGRSNILRFTLETYIRKDDVWGDFEDSLAYLDREMMLGTLDDWLDDFEVPDEDDDDFSAADYFAAQDITTSQVYILTQDLPKRFRKWISTLKPHGPTKPLDDIINRNPVIGTRCLTPTYQLIVLTPTYQLIVWLVKMGSTVCSYEKYTQNLCTCTKIALSQRLIDSKLKQDSY